MSSVECVVCVLASTGQQKHHWFKSTESSGWEQAVITAVRTAHIWITFQVCRWAGLLILECENKIQIYTANTLLSNLEIDCNKERTMGVNVYFYLHKLSSWEIWGQKSAAALVLIIVWSLGLMECEAGLALGVYLLILSSQESYMMVLWWTPLLEEKTKAVDLPTTCLIFHSWQMGRIEARWGDRQSSLLPGAPQFCMYFPHRWEGKQPGPGPFDSMTLSSHTLPHTHTLSPFTFTSRFWVLFNLKKRKKSKWLSGAVERELGS